MIPGYSFYHKCRLNKRGGGVGILVSQKIRCKLCSDLVSSMIENECLTLDITLQNGDHCLVSSMYRPPNVNAQTFLGCYNSILCQMKKENPKTIIIGLDHNMDFLKSAEHTLTNDFIQSNLDFGLVPTITRPTRITHSSATLIDNIIVSVTFIERFVHFLPQVSWTHVLISNSWQAWLGIVDQNWLKLALAKLALGQPISLKVVGMPTSIKTTVRSKLPFICMKYLTYPANSTRNPIP